MNRVLPSPVSVTDSIPWLNISTPAVENTIRREEGGGGIREEGGRKGGREGGREGGRRREEGGRKGGRKREGGREEGRGCQWELVEYLRRVSWV